MGAIIGTAIGSAIGVSVAPKKGSVTRDFVYEKGKMAKETSRGFRSLFWNVLKRILFGKPKKAQKKMKKTPKGMKEIPVEMEIIPPTRKEN